MSQGAPRIANCRFAFRCPMTWGSLQAIEETMRVRYCDKCETAVHLCLSERELDDHAMKGHCVAYVEFEDSAAEGHVADEDAQYVFSYDAQGELLVRKQGAARPVSLETATLGAVDFRSLRRDWLGGIEEVK